MTNIAWPRPWDHWFSPKHVPLPSTCCCNGLGYYRMQAPLGHPLFGKGIPCICKTNEIEARRAQELRRWSGLQDQQFFDLTFTNFHPEWSVPVDGMSKTKVFEEMSKAKRACEEYAKKPDGWLVLIGNVGSGKTHLSCAIANEVLKDGRAAHFNSVAAMLDLLRASYSCDSFDEWFERLQKVTVLALDDLGAERGTDWAREKLFELVDYRYINRLPLVVTTNLSLKDERIDLRLRSRLAEGSQVQRHGWARVLPLVAGDIRPARVYKPELEG